MQDAMKYREFYLSSIGLLEITASSRGVSGIKLYREKTKLSSESPNEITHSCVVQLKEYFHGVRQTFEIPFDFADAPYFYQEVWRTVYSIPYGKTRSYEDIAIRLGKPGAVRVVGTANAKNPLPIIVPCHRVIGKNGNLTGYAYGLETKRSLLKLENPAKFADQAVLFN